VVVVVGLLLLLLLAAAGAVCCCSGCCYAAAVMLLLLILLCRRQGGNDKAGRGEPGGYFGAAPFHGHGCCHYWMDLHRIIKGNEALVKKVFGSVRGW
jgi:hypothetical protein